MKSQLPFVILWAPYAALAFTATSTSRRFSTYIFADQEKLLREEILNRNAEIDLEGKYAIADGEFLDKLDETVQSPESTKVMDTTLNMQLSEESVQGKDRQSLLSKMERITKPRAYPLFLAEKAVEIVEDAIGDIAKKLGQSSASLNGVGRKEKLVILGSGWGAVSFVKDIDTELYDVTIISPRNHFTFTPMLVCCFYS